MIVTLSDIKKYLKIEATDTTYDSFLTLWLQKAQDLVEEYCNQIFEVKRFDDEIVDGSGSNFIYVKHLPLKRVISVQYTDDNITWNEWDGKIRMNDYVIYSDKKFPKGVGNIKVSYEAGWTNPPGLVYKVITEIVAEVWQEGPGLSRLGLASGGTSIQGSVSRNYRDLLERHEKLLKTLKIERAI